MDSGVACGVACPCPRHLAAVGGSLAKIFHRGAWAGRRCLEIAHFSFEPPVCPNGKTLKKTRGHAFALGLHPICIPVAIETSGLFFSPMAHSQEDVKHYCQAPRAGFCRSPPPLPLVQQGARFATSGGGQQMLFPNPFSTTRCQRSSLGSRPHPEARIHGRPHPCQTSRDQPHHGTVKPKIRPTTACCNGTAFVFLGFGMA